MLVYVNAPNIDDRVLARAADILREGGLVAFPTDTSWSVACGLDSRPGLERLKALKGTGKFVPTVICSRIQDFDTLSVLDTGAYRRIKPLVPGPFVHIFQARNAVHKHMAMKRPDVGLRIPDHPVPRALVVATGAPVFAITASRQMAREGWWDTEFAEENLFDYGAELEDLPGVDMVIDAGEVLPRRLATVVDWTGGEPEVIRQGIGEF